MSAQTNEHARRTIPYGHQISTNMQRVERVDWWYTDCRCGWQSHWQHSKARALACVVDHLDELGC